MDEAKLLMGRARRGDREAFAKLYERYFVPVFRYIFLRVPSRRDAEDLSQTVFIKALGSISQYQEKGKSPLSFFFTVARNSVIDHWRKKKTLSLEAWEEAYGTLADTSDSPEEAVERKRDVLRLERAISALTDDRQEVIILKFINGLSNREIAEILGKTEEAVRQLQARALLSLRNALKRHYVAG